MSTCPECGAPKADGMDCWWQMGAICSWEWSDPELAALHFYTVACYNLQHPATFTNESLLALKDVFRQVYDHGWTPEQIRKAMAPRVAGTTKVTRPESERRPVLRPWPMTVAHVYLVGQPAGAAARVRDWAAAIRREL